jgi:hypothetical protein
MVASDLFGNPTSTTSTPTHHFSIRWPETLRYSICRYVVRSHFYASGGISLSRY